MVYRFFIIIIVKWKCNLVIKCIGLFLFKDVLPVSTVCFWMFENN